MAIVKTTLGGAVAIDDLTIKVAGSTGTGKRKLINIDTEYLVQTADAKAESPLVLPVRRGDQGSFNAIHASGAIVYIGDANDFPPSPPGAQITQPYATTVISQTYTAAGIITLPQIKENVYVELLAGTGAAMSLPVPTYAQDGMEVTIMAMDAQAYVVTATAAGVATNAYNGTTDVATFGGAIGDNFRVKASNLLWLILYSKNVTAA